MACAYLLDQHHPDNKYQVTLIEKNAKLGGHTNTIEVPQEDGSLMGVDTGFIVYNEPNYPHLTGLFRTLGVSTQATSMSFGVSIDQGRLEYAGDNLNTLFAQRSNLLKPSFLRMVKDIVRFNHDAKALLEKPAADKQTLGDFLDKGRYCKPFHQHYLLPMAAAIWSCPPEQMRAFPALSFARFFNNHGLLNLRDRPQWQSVVGGSQAYIKKLFSQFRGQILRDNATLKVERSPTVQRIHLASGDVLECDQVVLATHADQALALLAQPSAVEQTLLEKFSYQDNTAFLHTDPWLMPRRRTVWSSWNYLADARQTTDAVAVTYWMNRLQCLSSREQYFVSLNPPQPPVADAVIAQMTYQHPVFDRAAMQAQRDLHSLQGEQHSWFAGSYFGYGFHEDALRSAVEVALHLGAQIPWLSDAENAAFHRRRTDR